MDIKTGVKDVTRISHIANVLIKHGLGFFINKYGFKLHIPLSKRISLSTYKKPDVPEVRFRKAFEELGGTYVKLGQMLSLRPDLIPEKYCKEFSKLQDKVPPFSFEKVKKIISAEIGKPSEKIFKHIDKKPLGSASLGQVHSAALHNGKKAVIKVLRPKIKEKVMTDIDIMKHIAKRLENTKSFGRYSPKTIVNEFERYTKKELDYINEAKNIEKFYDNLSKEDYVRIPKVFHQYTTKRILTLEFLKGEKLTSLLKSKKKFNKKSVMNSLVKATLKQVFDQGTFHADLHPGNILVIDKGKVGLLDFGIVGNLSNYYRLEGLKVYVALVNKNTDDVVRHTLRLGRPSSETDVESFRKEVEDIISGWHGTQLREVRVTHMLHRLFESAVKHGIEMPVDTILLAKALVTLEGTCLMLNPKFNFVKHSQKYVKKYVHPKKITKENMKLFMARSREMAEVLEMIPSETLAVLEKLRSGIIKVDIDDTDLKRLALDIDKSSNRLSYALIVAALVISGALIMMSNTGPLIGGFSIPAIVLYIIAAFMFMILLGSIIREGALWR